MKRIFLALMLVSTGLMLSSCETTEERQARIQREEAAIDAEQAARCEGWGAKPGTAAYVDCRRTLYAQMRQERAMKAALDRQEQMAAMREQMDLMRPRRCISRVQGSQTVTFCE